MRGPRGNQRRAWGAITCLLWLLSVEIMPDLHEALHDAGSHHHDGEQIVADDHDHEHDHDAVDHHERDREIPQAELDHPEHAHAGGGLAHHATALHPAPRPILEPVSVDRRASFARPTHARALVSASLLAACARGPPAPPFASRSSSL